MQPQRIEYKRPDEPEYLYSVLIKQESGKHYCRLEEYKQDMMSRADMTGKDIQAKYYERVQFVDFDINTVIGDFLNICIENKFSENWKEHPFFFGRDFSLFQIQKTYPPEMRYITRMQPPLPILCQDLSIFFNAQHDSIFFTIDEFEIIKSFYGIQINYEVLYKSEEEIEMIEKIAPIDSIPEKYKYKIGFQRFSYGLSNIDDIKILKKAEKLYDYTCSSLSEILFAVWHYCVVNSFKFARCKHCGSLFTTQTLKEKYCNRNSPYKGYETYTCETAVKRIKKKLDDRKDSIYNNWIVKYGSGSELVCNFLNSCAIYKAAIKNHASVDNYRIYENYLYSDMFPQRWVQE